MSGLTQTREGLASERVVELEHWATERRELGRRLDVQLDALRDAHAGATHRFNDRMRGWARRLCPDIAQKGRRPQRKECQRPYGARPRPKEWPRRGCPASLTSDSCCCHAIASSRYRRTDFEREYDEQLGSCRACTPGTHFLAIGLICRGGHSAPRLGPCSTSAARCRSSTAWRRRRVCRQRRGRA